MDSANQYYFIYLPFDNAKQMYNSNQGLRMYNYLRKNGVENSKIYFVGEGDKALTDRAIKLFKVLKLNLITGSLNPEYIDKISQAVRLILKRLDGNKKALLCVTGDNRTLTEYAFRHEIALQDLSGKLFLGSLLEMKNEVRQSYKLSNELRVSAQILLLKIWVVAHYFRKDFEKFVQIQIG